MDNAMVSGYREMILAALQGISNIVIKSPLDDLEKFVEIYNNPDHALLDF
ncbi:MAG: hypothetical protein ACI350_05165 [Prevotella sp.]